MSTYKELQAQIRDLEKQAEQARKAEMAGAKEQILSIMREYDLSPADVLKGSTAATKTASKNPAPVLYRNDESGETWSGRGRAPRWIADKDREKFRIAQTQH